MEWLKKFFSVFFIGTFLMAGAVGCSSSTWLGSSSTADKQLSSLKQLYKEGIITKEEFNRLKSVSDKPWPRDVEAEFRKVKQLYDEGIIGKPVVNDLHRYATVNTEFAYWRAFISSSKLSDWPTEVEANLRSLRQLYDEGIITESMLSGRQSLTKANDPWLKDVEANLRSLKRVYDDGIITDSEYDALKKLSMASWSVDFEKQLRGLKRLYDEGIITDSEYDALKKVSRKSWPTNLETQLRGVKQLYDAGSITASEFNALKKEYMKEVLEVQ